MLIAAPSGAALATLFTVRVAPAVPHGPKVTAERLATTRTGTPYRLGRESADDPVKPLSAGTSMTGQQIVLAIRRARSPPHLPSPAR
jgi:hypothetical protein